MDAIAGIGGEMAARTDRAALPLRILVVHNRYQERGGEDAVVERESQALARAGQTVETLLVSNDVIRTPMDRLRAAFEAPRAPRGIATVLEAVHRFRPDVVHLHNTFPLISPAVHTVLAAEGVATVQTLHNFRITCANAMLTRDGVPCEDCIGGSPYQAVLHRCYRGSRLGSLAVARMIDLHRKGGTWRRDVARFIALTPFAKSRFVEAGVPAERIRVKPNGLPDPGLPGDAPRSGLLFVGRLTAEKGVAVLAAAASRSRAGITVIGDGPLAAELRGRDHITLLGFQDRETVARAMAQAAAVIVPSLWYEGLPMVVAEAFAAGTPVIVSAIGALAEIVTDRVTGLHTRPGDPDDLAQACNRIVDDPEAARRMGHGARAVFERDWSEAVTTSSLLAILREAIAERATGALRHAS